MKPEIIKIIITPLCIVKSAINFSFWIRVPPEDIDMQKFCCNRKMTFFNTLTKAPEANMTHKHVTLCTYLLHLHLEKNCLGAISTFKNKAYKEH